MPDIAVVVVAFQSSSTLRGCLTSILEDEATRVVVVDNSSDRATHDLCDRIAKDYPGRLSYDDPGLNLGYAKGCNRGFATLAPVDLVAIVNPDVSLEHSLSELAALRDFGARDVITGRLVSPTAPHSVNARPPISFARELGKALFGSRAYRLRGLPVPDGRVHEVGQVDGALMLLCADTWRRVGGFDERFELYYEDVDLCARIRESGRCLFVNRRWGAHIGGHSFERSDGRAFIALRVSRSRYALKWWHPRWLAGAAVRSITTMEWVSRTITRQPEGQVVRTLARGRVAAELRRPGSQQILDGDLAAGGN